MDPFPLRARRVRTLGEATLSLSRKRCVLFAHDATDTLWIGTERGAFGFAIPSGAPRGANPTIDCRAIAATGDTLLLVGQKNIGTLDARKGARGPAIESGLNQWTPCAALGSPARVLYGASHLRFWVDGRVRKLASKSPAKRWTLSPGGGLAAGVTRKKTASLFDVAQRVELPAPTVAKVVLAHCLDDRTVLLATSDGTLVEWDVAGAREARRWRLAKAPIALASTHDGRTLAVVSQEALWVIDRAAGRVRELARGRFFDGVAMVEGGRWIAVRVGACAVQVFDGATGEVLCGGSLAAGPIASVQWSHGDRVAAQAKGDPVLRVWNASNGEHVAVELDASMGSTELSPDGTRLAVVAQGAVKVVEVATGVVLHERAFAGPSHVAWTADGDALVVGGGVASTPRWVARWALGATLVWRHEDTTRRPDGDHAYAWLEGLWVDDDEVVYAVDNALQVLASADGAPRGRRTLMGWSYLSTRMPWLDAGVVLVRGMHEENNGYDYVIEVASWDVAHQTLRWHQRLDAAGASVLDAARARCASSVRARVLLLDANTGAELGHFTLATESDEVTALAFAPDGRLAVGTHRGLVHVYALEA